MRQATQIGTAERATFEHLYLKASQSNIKSIKDLSQYTGVSVEDLQNYLSRWFYDEVPVNFDLLKRFTPAQLQETYQVIADEESEEIDVIAPEAVIAPSLSDTPDIIAAPADNVVIDMPIVNIALEEELLNGAPSQFDASFLWSLIDPRPSFKPMTLRVVIWWAVLLGSLAGLIYGGIKKDIFNGLKEWAYANNIPAIILLYIYEPLLLAIEMFATDKYPDEVPPIPHNHNVQILDNPTHLLQPLHLLNLNPNPELAVIIPCHNSADFIAKTIKAALRHVAPHQIFIMDNGRGEYPADNTQEIVHAIHHSINYFWLPKIGNKTIAILIGAQYVRRHRHELILSIITDDDTLLPKNFVIKHKFFADSCVKGIVYPIRGTSPYKKPPLLSRWQDHEYKIADLELAFLDQSDSVYRPHGAVSLWKTKSLVKILKKHNGIFKGEDVMMGVILKHLDNVDGGSKLRLDRDCYFDTTVPQTYFGKSPNLYQQRVRSWNEAMFLYPWNLLLKPLLTIHKGSPLSILKMKNSQLYNLYTHINYILRYPFIALISKNPQFWWIFGILKSIDIMMSAIFNYVKLPSHLRSDLLTTLTFPIYKETLSIMGTLAALRVLFVSGATQPHPRSINYQIGHELICISEETRIPKPHGATPITQESRHRTNSIAETIQRSEEMHSVEVQSFLNDPIEGDKILINPANKYVPRATVEEALAACASGQDDANQEDALSVYSDPPSPINNQRFAFFATNKLPSNPPHKKSYLESRYKESRV